MVMRKQITWLVSFIGFCTLAFSESLRVVATTTLVGDVVQTIGGETISLNILMRPGADPHLFEPTPRDLAQLAEADVLFINGVGLENFMKVLTQCNPHARIVSVSDGIALHKAAEHDHDEHEEHGENDPHVWFNPLNVIVWAQNIEKTLGTLAPDQAAIYKTNSERYIEELTALDTWIQQEVSKLKPEQRVLVTDHDEFGYFTERYEFTCVGTILPNISTLSEPTARQLADLHDAIQHQNIRALFMGKTTNPTLGARIAQDAGIRVVSLFTGSLGEKGGPADTYLNYMRYNVQAIVDALAPQEP